MVREIGKGKKKRIEKEDIEVKEGLKGGKGGNV